MTYRLHNDFFIPRTKRDLLAALLPGWRGSKTDLRQMRIKRLRAIFIAQRNRVLRGLSGR